MGRGPSIEGRKSAGDARRGQLFTKLIREITVAARRGGADPASNSRLRLAIDKALHANMPKDTIERALKRGSGEAGGENFEEIRYEGYGPGGVAVMVDCMTDNATRTVADVRHAFSKHGGNMATSGAVAYLFARIGEIEFDTGSDAAAEEKILDAALEAGADDVVSQSGTTTVLVPPERFEAVKKSLEAAGLKAAHADVVMRPATTVAVAGEQAETLAELLDALHALDDVQNVFSNAELPDS